MWKKSIDDIKVICKVCNVEMVLESQRNGIQGLFTCPVCVDQANVKVYHKDDTIETTKPKKR